MLKTQITHPTWRAKKRPVAYVRYLEVMLPAEMMDEHNGNADGFLDMVAAYVTASHPGLPALLMLGAELYLPDRPLQAGEESPLALYYLSYQEVFDDEAVVSNRFVYIIHSDEEVVSIPEWLGEHRYEPFELRGDMPDDPRGDALAYTPPLVIDDDEGHCSTASVHALELCDSDAELELCTV